MSNQELTDIWIATATTLNENLVDRWTLRFVIDDVELVPQTAEQLDAVGVTVVPHGGPLEYLVAFPPPVVREVATILVQQGASLCSDQSFQSEP